MLRLRATLVAMAAARPWRGGWSADRGVDFGLARAPILTSPAPGDPGRTVAAESPSFLDAGEDAPPGAVVRRYVSLAAARAEAAAEPVPRRPLQAWSRLPPRPSRP